VLTGFSVVFAEGKGLVLESYSVRTDVRFRELSPAAVKAYVARGESLDKAGAYSAQGHGAILIEAIRGSYTNVIGLPMVEVTGVLESLGAGTLFGQKG
jgi:septum formation protein